jgi:uncharacterized repeat protein (TIGR01451 family)
VNDVTISGLTIENGNAGSGSNGSNDNVSIPDNNDTAEVDGGGVGGNGGGIYNAGSLKLTNDTVSGNTAGSGGNGGDGGGIYNSGSLTLTDDAVSGNATGSGGTGGDYDANVAGNDNTLNIGSGNGGDGSGIYNTSAGSLTLTNDTLFCNTTGSGGNPGAGEVTATGEGDTFNIYEGIGGTGGAVYNDGTAAITASTVSTNGASSGGGIALDGSTLTLADTIVANSSSGGNCAYAGGTVIDGGYNLDSGTTCGLTGSDDTTNVSPQLGPLEENGGPTDTMALASTSPAVDAIPPGINGCGTTLTTDQRGALRPNESRCDIGAYEFGDVAVQTLKARPSSVHKNSDLTYTATVSNAGATDATGVTVTDTLPAGERFTSAAASQGSCSTSSSTVTCSLGEVGAAISPTVTIVVKVTGKEGKTLSDTATVSATSGDTIPSNDSKTLSLTVS